MRALRLTAPTVLELCEIPVPEPGPGEVLLQVGGAGLCHSDLHVREIPIAVFPLPLTLGHEVAGTVDGRPVLVHLVWGCGRCRSCVAGRDNVCTALGRQVAPASPGLGPQGGMAEYAAVPVSSLVDIEGLDPVAAAPLADAALTPYHAIAGELGRLRAGSTAVVIGVGGLGHMGVQILRAITPARVVAVDLDERKRATALEVGAHEALASDESTAARVLDLTAGQGADAVFDFTGVQATLDLAAACVAPGGALRVVGLGGGTLSYPASGDATALPWGVSVTRAYGGTRQDLSEVVALARSGAIAVHVEAVPLDEGVAAFERLHRGDVDGRLVLVP
jgi:propanol-preferring alcohol dehydrogenase